ncbi:hypothetical protein CGMCC3_g1109 [Colletotrichum fructicola]|nr:uncharacterized protein CGMCC3_g1109 [Colletotrichum fructicola]KAE9582806.1 hypothetical protein CGMCC3_g1109 [Colletotrichum fructicola]
MVHLCSLVFPFLPAQGFGGEAPGQTIVKNKTQKEKETTGSVGTQGQDAQGKPKERRWTSMGMPGKNKDADGNSRHAEVPTQ